MSLADEPHNLNTTGFDPDFASASSWAEMYRAAGLQVVPSKKKHPDLHKWADLQDVIAPAFTFERWYGTGGEHASNGNMGIITGPCSNNVFVIDLDEHLKPQAAAWWRDLIEFEASGIEPETPEQRTGGGGRQKLFRAPPGYYVPTRKTDIGVDIRGTGGFAVMPPTAHDVSKREYAWLPGAGPWERKIAMAEPWLLEAIEALTDAHGGDQGPRQRTASPDGDYTPFGSRQDGREDEMFRAVWRAVLEYYRDVGGFAIPPKTADWEPVAAAGYEAYELKVINRHPEMDKRAGLEKDGRGPTEWMKKWRREMRNWGSPKMQREAAKPPPKEEPPPEQPKVDPETGEVLPLLLTAEQFLRGYVPPNYQVDGVLQKSYLYAFTARTGHGKTAVAMLMGSCIARGVPFHGHPTEPGRVLFLAGENPQDVRVRYKVLADSEQFSPEGIPFHFVDGVINIAASLPKIREEATKIGDLALIIVDTATAYFRGDDSNSNVQQGQFAQLLRQLIKLPGAPAVLVNCHPVKNAQQDNLIPLGGSNFLNEIDGNLTLWADDKTCAFHHHPAKWRGAPFEQIEFELRTMVSDTVKDAKGRHMPSVVAVPITEQGAERRGAVAEADEDMVLGLIHTHKTASLSEIARKAGFVLPNGQPYKSKIQRIIERMKASKLIFKYRGSKYRLTKKGCKVAGVTWEKDENDD